MLQECHKKEAIGIDSKGVHETTEQAKYASTGEMGSYRSTER